MASIYDIEFNDTRENIIRKINNNFKALSVNLTKKANQRIRISTDSLVDDINDLIDKLNLISKIFHGYSESSAGAHVKDIVCPEFTSADLIPGTVLLATFTYAQNYNGAPRLNVNNTGEIDCRRRGNSTDMLHVWQSSEYVAFMYDGTYWQMIESGYATTSYYGMTMLTDSASSTSQVTAATPNAVKQAYDLAKKKLDATWEHDDILWVIDNDTVGEVMKKTTVTNYRDLVVRCVGEDGNPCFTPLCLIPEDTYQNYTANGKTFKMKIATDDNNKLYWVVPAGKWELWMRKQTMI